MMTDSNAYEEIVDKHNELHEQLINSTDSIPTEVFLDFIEQTRLAGKVTPDVDQRNKLRAIIRQWAVEIYKRTGEQPLVQLMPLDQEKFPTPDETDSTKQNDTRPSLFWIQIVSVIAVVLIISYVLLFTEDNPFISTTPTYTATPTPTTNAIVNASLTLTFTPTNTSIPTPSPSHTPSPTFTPTPSRTSTPRPTPPSGSLIVANFDTCSGINNLGGQMGAAYNSPDFLLEQYVPENGRGCVAQLEYSINAWSAFWMKLQGADLSTNRMLTFDIRADEPVLDAMKIELKRAGNTEISIIYISSISTEWQTISVNLDDFVSTGFTSELSIFTDMEELVFTFEADRSGDSGLVYLDNVRFDP